MTESDHQPDLIDRELIPARSRVSYSREIGEAVVTENIFGKARVRIIRKDDKWPGILWTAAIIGVVAAAVAVWQVWLASQQMEDMPEAQPAAKVMEGAPAMPPVASAVEAIQPPGHPASAVAARPMVVPHSAPAAKPVVPYQTMLPQSAPRAVTPASGVVPARPIASPRPAFVKPQSAPQAAGTLAAPPVVAAQPKPLPVRPAASAAAATTPLKPPVAAGSQPAIPPLASPLSKPATEPVNQ